MNKYQNLYCKIFIDTDEEREFMLKSIANIISGVLENKTISTDCMEVDVMNNEDFSEVQRIEESHGFLYSRYYLEIEPKENIKQEEYISDIAMLLEKLWSLGYKAICASDFEEELPRKGGYRYENR